MDITKHIFSEDEIEQLKQYRDAQSDIRLKMRFIAILLLAKNITIEQVAFSIGKDVKTIKNWGNNYLNNGIDSLNYFNYKPKQAYLSEDQIEQVIKWVKEENPATTKEVKYYIEKEFKVNYKVESVRQILRKYGLKFLKPKKVPGNPPTEQKQKEFVEKYYDMRNNSEEGTIFIFADVMHLHHQNEPGYYWGDPTDTPVIKTNSGRKRLNIIGGYNIEDHSIVHFTGEEKCNAKRVIEFCEELIKKYSLAPKIIVFLDNAKYFKAKLVSDWLEQHPQVQFEPLPAYGPNLNLIERFWKFAKKKLVKNTYYEQYKTFRATVFRFLNNVKDYIDKLKTLMVEKFQIIKYKAA